LLQSLEQVLANINKLNRSLEGVIAVGNEFGSVEALWSQFENVMGHDPNAQEQPQGEQHEEDATYVTEDHAQSERDERSRSRGRSQASSRR
jgi:DASH complex subunit DAD1